MNKPIGDSITDDTESLKMIMDGAEIRKCYREDLLDCIKNLEAENVELKKQIVDTQQHHCKLHDAITERAEKAEKKIEQLKEALKKCDPNHGFGYCYSCDAKFNEICKNKENGNDGHRANCEYVRLTGGAE